MVDEILINLECELEKQSIHYKEKVVGFKIHPASFSYSSF
jgi:hypothetical protein